MIGIHGLLRKSVQTHSLVANSTSAYHVLAVSSRRQSSVHTNHTHATTIRWKPASGTVVSCHYLCSHLNEIIVIRHTVKHTSPAYTAMDVVCDGDTCAVLLTQCADTTPVF